MKKLFYIFALALCFFGVRSSTSLAAMLYFDPSAHAVPVGKPFSIELLVDATSSVNAVSAVLELPDGVRAVDSSDGNSVINYFILRPAFDETSNTVSFAGIVPGGFSGNRALLLTLTLVADAPGVYAFDYDHAKTSLRLNDPTGSEDKISIAPLSIEASADAASLGSLPPDAFPPEAFTPLVSRLTPGGEYFLVFDTQDKQSGMASFEVAESEKGAADYSKLDWQKTESPYLIHDQTLKSFMYVRAFDKAGNVRFEEVRPAEGRGWYGRGLGLILFIMILMAALVFIRRKRHHAH